MKRLAGVLLLAAALLALRGIALAGPGSPDWAFSDLRTLVADGVIDGYRADDFASKPSLSRTEMALLTARALARVEASGASPADQARVQALSNEFRSDLLVLGVRESDLSKLRSALDARTKRTQRLAFAGELIAGSSLGIEPSFIISVPKSGSFTHLFAHVGVLQNAPDSIAGLTLGGHTALQPLQHGASLGGTLGLSDFYFSVARISGDVLYANPANVLAGTGFSASSFAVTPQQGGFVRFGAHDSLTGRLVQHLGLTGASIGLSYNHLFDAVPSPVASNEVSKTIFGIDVSLPVFARSGWHPAVYAEAASSSANRPAAAATLPVLFTSQNEIDRALVAGITFRVRSISGNVQYQSVGPNFASGVVPMPGFFGLTLANPQVTAANFTGPPVVPSAGPAFTPFEDTIPFSNSTLVPNSQGVKIELSTPVRIGAYTVQGNFSAAHLQELAANAYGASSAARGTDDRLRAGATFDLRALGRPLNLDVSASLETLKRTNATALTYLPYNANAQGPDPGEFATAPLGVNPVTFNPNFVNVTRRSLNAAAAMPLTRDLSVNVQYNAQYYSGSYSSVNQNIDVRKDFYLGNLTYSIPRTSSAITFSAKQYHYRDAFVPNYNLTQNRADLNFTVKF